MPTTSEKSNDECPKEEGKSGVAKEFKPIILSGSFKGS
jgi:hypothetical protein